MLQARGRPWGRLLFLLLVIGVAVEGCWAAPATTTIRDTVYRGDGSPAAGGTLLISWPAFISPEAVANRQIVDEGKFKEGLSKVIDGTVECLNASLWAKAK